jgi:hypothetical protein
MGARAGFHALGLSAALVMASGAMLSNDAMAQADDVTVQADDVTVQADEATGEADAATINAEDASAQTDDVTAQDEAVEQPVAPAQAAAVDRPVKSNLDQSAVRAAPVAPSPRPTRTSTRGTALPKILGVYR